MSAPRLNKLRTIMCSTGLDAVALIPGPNLRYLTGVHHYLMERPTVLFIPKEGECVSIAPQLETLLFDRHALPSRRHVWADSEGYAGAFKAALEELDLAGKTLGVEGLRMRFFEGEALRQYAPGATITDAEMPLAALRLHKDADEIALLRRAIAITEAALQKTLEAVKVGMIERELANLLEQHMKDLGSEGLSFETILRGGSSTTLPHSNPEDYALKPGDPLLFDFGATFGGYHADITRTFFVGDVSGEFRDFYNVVKTANEAGRAAVRPGVTAESVDQAARQVFINAGYESLIRHRTGHGLGLEIHEHPYIVEGNTQLLEPGMVFTVEPGIYNPGVIGVRIEDDVMVTQDGGESLTTFPRDLMVVG